MGVSTGESPENPHPSDLPGPSRPSFAFRYERSWGDACLAGVVSAGLSWVFGGELRAP
jgi:hypothetical protein